jgi:TrmH family RNA methyltransferase
VQRLRRLVRRRSLRQSERVFVLEGAKVVAAALEAGVPLEGLYLAPEGGEDPATAALVDRARDAGVRRHHLAPGVMERVADTVTPQPVLALAPFLDVDLDRLAGASLVVVCADVRDPGNAGTVLRSAAAAGAEGVVVCRGSVDLYNPKVVRASAGALCNLTVVVGDDPLAVVDRLGQFGLARLGAVVGGGTDYTEVDMVAPVAVVLGNEATGLPPELAGAVDTRVSIPMAGRTESLNVGVTAAVLCFEAARQRRAVRGSGSVDEGVLTAGA